MNIQKAIEHGPVEIEDFPMNSMVIFHSFLYVHQRVSEVFRMVNDDDSYFSKAFSAY